jgi:hypothetical protein
MISSQTKKGIGNFADARDWTHEMKDGRIIEARASR